MNNDKNPQLPLIDLLADKILQAAIIKCKMLERITDSSIYLIDFMGNSLLYISDNDLSFPDKPEGQVKFDTSFLRQKVDSDDALPLLNSYNAIKKYLQTADCNFPEIDYFSCTYRLLRGKHHLMVHQRTIPEIVQGSPRLAICTISTSVAKYAGNLEIYYCGGKEYAKYSLHRRQWNSRQPIIKLTEQECSLVKQAKRGLSTHDIADMLNLSEGRVRNFSSQLYDKLEVKSMAQALIHLSNYPQKLL
ncbi:hypothetical protein FACS189430_07130 [Bacteroidia bacterium]|nr:hypothetical protein FACS189430_07130 [Bacteroidia bacterium]